MRFGVEGWRKDWGVYLYADNLFDKDAIVDSEASAISLGRKLVQSARPRLYGLNFRKSFTF